MLKRALLLAGFALAIGENANADLIFDFVNGGPIDESSVGDSFTRGSVTFTIEEIRYPDLTGVTVANPNPGPIVSRSGTFRGNASPAGFGIDNETITNGNFDTVYGPGGESSNFNFDETLVFSFDRDVTFDSIDFAALNGTDAFDIEVDGLTFTFNDGNTDSSDVATNPFAATIFDANTNFALTFVGGMADVARIEAFVVNDATPVPEPGSMMLLSICGIGFAGSRWRRRRDANHIDANEPAST